MIKSGDSNEEIQFLGAVLIIGLVLGFAGFTTIENDFSGQASVAVLQSFEAQPKLPSFCIKNGDDSVFVRNTVQYRDFAGARQVVYDFCRDAGGTGPQVLVEYGCRGDELSFTDVHCDYGCKDGRCTKR